MTNGVIDYVRAEVDIFFEPNHVSCAFCPLLDESPRWRCRRTGEYLHEIKNLRGMFCPLRLEEKE